MDFCCQALHVKLSTYTIKHQIACNVQVSSCSDVKLSNVLRDPEVGVLGEVEYEEVDHADPLQDVQDERTEVAALEKGVE